MEGAGLWPPSSEQEQNDLNFPNSQARQTSGQLICVLANGVANKRLRRSPVAIVRNKLLRC